MPVYGNFLVSKNYLISKISFVWVESRNWMIFTISLVKVVPRGWMGLGIDVAYPL